MNDFVTDSHAFCAFDRESVVAWSDRCSGPATYYVFHQIVSCCDWLTVSGCLYAYRERHSVIVIVILIVIRDRTSQMPDR